jgi:hypothetical protein
MQLTQMHDCAKIAMPVTGRMLTLTEYECGRAQIAIEWVARSEKPVVEIGGRPIQGCDLLGLTKDLDRCITQSREQVRGFVMPDRMSGYCCYGFYRYPWAMKALLSVYGDERQESLNDPCRRVWLQGLVFGYSPEAIQRFISSASCEQASTLRRNPYRFPFRYRKVEIYGTLARLFQRRNSRSDRYRRLG